MRDPFAGYDAWLERPYQDMMEEGERFMEWVEENDYDLATESVEAEKAYMEWIEGQYEDAAEAQYEDYLDRMDYEAHELDDYFDEGW